MALVLADNLAQVVFNRRRSTAKPRRRRDIEEDLPGRAIDDGGVADVCGEEVEVDAHGRICRRGAVGREGLWDRGRVGRHSVRGSRIRREVVQQSCLGRPSGHYSNRLGTDVGRGNPCPVGFPIPKPVWPGLRG